MQWWERRVGKSWMEGELFKSGHATGNNERPSNARASLERGTSVAIPDLESALLAAVAWTGGGGGEGKGGGGEDEASLEGSRCCNTLYTEIRALAQAGTTVAPGLLKRGPVVEPVVPRSISDDILFNLSRKEARARV